VIAAPAFGSGAVLASELVGFPAAALGATLVLVVMNGFFVGAEFGLLASMKARVEPMADEGQASARRALRAMGNLGPVLAATQLGITVCSLALGAVAEPAIAGMFRNLFGLTDFPEGLSATISVIIALAIVVFVHLLVGEMVPKSLALAAPERMLLAVAGPMNAVVWLLRPVIWVLASIARVGARLCGVEPTDELRSAATAAELGVMLAESGEHGLLGAEEVDLLTGALSFGDRQVSEVMVPRDDIIAVSKWATVGQIEDVIHDTGHTRIVVTDVARSGTPDLDTILGFVHAKDLIGLAETDRDLPLPLRPRPILAIPSHESLDEVLVAMRARQAHLAVVTATSTRTVGIVTLEDVLESIVGDIYDESDRRPDDQPESGPDDERTDERADQRNGANDRERDT
jgi:CBS domain containing-hemolysin-like protein